VATICKVPFLGAYALFSLKLFSYYFIKIQQNVQLQHSFSALMQCH